VTSTLIDAPLLRVGVPAGADSGLRKPSQVMIDKTMTVRRDRVGPPIRRIDTDALVEVQRRLAVFLGIAK
jgi:mRNA interferase MazF